MMKLQKENQKDNQKENYIKEIISNYQKSPKNEKTIIIKNLVHIPFKHLIKSGCKNSLKKTYSKYKKQIVKKNQVQKNKKIKEDFIVKFLKEETSPSPNKINKKKNQNIRTFIGPISKLFNKFKIYLNKYNEEKNNEINYLKISESYFRQYLKNSKIFKKAVTKTDFCNQCLQFLKLKNPTKEEIEIQEEHVKTKNEIKNKIKEKKKNLKNGECMLFFDFKENICIKGGVEKINGSLYESNENYYNRSLILCSGVVIYYRKNEEIEKK